MIKLSIQTVTYFVFWGQNHMKWIGHFVDLELYAGHYILFKICSCRHFAKETCHIKQKLEKSSFENIFVFEIWLKNSSISSKYGNHSWNFPRKWT